jgi:hypothetical protein
VIVNGQPKSHSGEGHFWGNLLVTLVCVVLFVACIYAMGFWSFENVWIPGLIALALAVLTFIIPQQFIGRSDTLDHEAIYVEDSSTRHAGH